MTHGVGKRFVDVIDTVRVISDQHAEIHDGVSFVSSYKSPEGADIADNGTIVFLIRCGARQPNLIFTTALGGDAEVEFYKNTLVSGYGTQLAAASLNQTANLYIPTTRIYLTPTVTDIGTRILNYLVPGGTGAVLSAGGLAQRDSEFILVANTNYLIRLTNRAGSAQPGSIIVEWYEPKE